jgi:hypothetical protein
VVSRMILFRVYRLSSGSQPFPGGRVDSSVFLVFHVCAIVHVFWVKRTVFFSSILPFHYYACMRVRLAFVEHLDLIHSLFFDVLNAIRYPENRFRACKPQWLLEHPRWNRID